MYYSNGAVTVDQHFARFASKSYAINKINTVDVQARRPYGEGLTVLFGALTAVCLITLFTGSLTAIVFVLLFGALTVWAYKRSKTLEYILILMTSSSSAQAYTTRDENEIAELRDAIETAMTAAHDREYRVHHDHTLRRAPDDADDDTIDVRPAKGGTIRQRLLR